MSQTTHVVKSIVSGNGSSDTGGIASFKGFVFGKVQFSMSDGSNVPSGSFQVLVSPDGEYFEAAKDADNSEIAAQAFSNTSRIFNLPVETVTCAKAKIKLSAPLSAGADLIATFYLYDNS